MVPAARAERGAPAGVFAFVYVESNVGGASGGHAGLRLEDRVYHFQRFPDGTLRLVRDEWARFRRLYGELQNRPLHLAYLAVDPAAEERVREHLDRKWAGQELALARRDRLMQDAAWSAALGAGTPPPPLRGAGLLETGLRDAEPGVRLRAAVERRAGDGAIAAALARAEQRLAAQSGAPELDLEALREALLEREALRALEEGRGVDEAALVEAGGDTAASLTDPERVALAGFAAGLERTLAGLVRSERPDRGYPLALAIARWHAAARSLASGRLLLLDPFPDDARWVVPERELAPGSAALLAERARALEAEARRVLLGAGVPDEARFAWLEESAGRLAELERGAGGGAMRESPGRLLPSRGRRLPPPPLRADPAALHARAAGALAAAQAGLEARFGYGLLTRNCVTELVRAVAGAFPDAGSLQAALGGELRPGERLGFVPFVFFEQVRERLRVVRLEDLPSHRQRELARLERKEGAARAYLGETNVLTATLYTPVERDGAFLLFTDDAFWPRPLYGVLNLGYGLGSAALGALLAPFDGGREAAFGARGILFSLPELVFQNVRKGSYEVLPEEARARPLRSASARSSARSWP